MGISQAGLQMVVTLLSWTVVIIRVMPICDLHVTKLLLCFFAGRRQEVDWPLIPFLDVKGRLPVIMFTGWREGAEQRLCVWLGVVRFPLW